MDQPTVSIKSSNVPDFFIPNSPCLNKLPPYKRGAILKHSYYTGSFKVIRRRRIGNKKTGYRYYEVVKHDESGRKVWIPMEKPEFSLWTIMDMICWWMDDLFGLLKSLECRRRKPRRYGDIE